MKVFQTSLLNLCSSSVARLAVKAIPWLQGQQATYETMAWRVNQHHLVFQCENQSYVGTRLRDDGPNHAGLRDTLLTVVPSKPSHASHREWVQSFLDRVRKEDDVLCSEFLLNIYYEGTSEASHPERDAIVSLIRSHDSRSSLVETDLTQGRSLRPGPYAVIDGVVWQVAKLYNDTQGAFMVPLVPHEGASEAPFQQLHTTGGRYQALGIAVPSRLSSGQDRPLEGMRFAAKDMFSVKGIEVTLCNKAYYDISAPSTFTAPVLHKLLDAGANLVGTTKLSSMLSREEPTEAVDYQQPFNPRADGYQSPAGSSSGSAAAVAMYDWLDFSVAEDTSGSGRRPAAANGCFQFRPTHDSVDLAGMKITIERFDTPVIHARDFDVIDRIAPLWRKTPATVGDTKTNTDVLIIYPQDFLPKDQPEHISKLDEFVSDLERATGSSATRPTLASLWQNRPPPNMSVNSSSLSTSETHSSPPESISAYLRSVLVQTYYREFYLSQSEFRTTYRARYDRDPFVNSFVKWRWNLGAAVTDAENAEGSRRLDVYRSWLLETVMRATGSSDTEYVSLSSSPLAILVLPISEGSPNYRDKPPSSPTVQNGFDPLYLSPILAGPDLVIPIGEVGYDSRISGTREMLPICVSVLGTPGRDQDFLDVIRKVLVQSGRPMKVRTGRRMFDGDDEERNRSSG